MNQKNSGKMPSIIVNNILFKGPQLITHGGIKIKRRYYPRDLSQWGCYLILGYLRRPSKHFVKIVPTKVNVKNNSKAKDLVIVELQFIPKFWNWKISLKIE